MIRAALEGLPGAGDYDGEYLWVPRLAESGDDLADSDYDEGPVVLRVPRGPVTDWLAGVEALRSAQTEFEAAKQVWEAAQEAWAAAQAAYREQIEEPLQRIVQQAAAAEDAREAAEEEQRRAAHEAARAAEQAVLNAQHGPAEYVLVTRERRRKYDKVVTRTLHRSTCRHADLPGWRDADEVRAAEALAAALGGASLCRACKVEDRLRDALPDAGERLDSYHAEQQDMKRPMQERKVRRILDSVAHRMWVDPQRGGGRDGWTTTSETDWSHPEKSHMLVQWTSPGFGTTSFPPHVLPDLLKALLRGGYHVTLVEHERRDPLNNTRRYTGIQVIRMTVGQEKLTNQMGVDLVYDAVMIAGLTSQEALQQAERGYLTADKIAVLGGLRGQ